MNMMVGAMTVEEAKAMLLASGASVATLKEALASLFTETKTKKAQETDIDPGAGRGHSARPSPRQGRGRPLSQQG